MVLANIIDEQFEFNHAVTAPASSALVNVSGCTNVVFEVVISASSSPATASAQLQGSLDGVNFYNEGTAQAITGNGALAVQVVDPGYRLYKWVYAIASGSFTANSFCLGKGPE